MPYKFHEPHRHHIEKMRFKVTNWSAYDEGLRSRGSLTFWIEEVVLQSWYAAPRTTPGGQPIYADGAIEMILTLGMVYHLPLGQTEGFARSLLSLMNLSLPVPRHSTLSRRRKTLDIQPIKPSARGPIDIVLDGSGLKVFGAGEWCVEKHGKSQRRWRKLSIGLDPESGEIVAFMGLDLPVPDHGTLSRRGGGLVRSRRLSSAKDSLDLVMDSTGLKIHGPGEWRCERFGEKKAGKPRRSWRKLHLGIDPVRRIKEG